MERTNNPFYYYYETIDLHGLDALTALIKVNEFINDNIKLKKYGIIIVHGKGSGILKKAVHEYLRKDKRVEKYEIDIYNDGTTIVKLKDE